MKALYDFRKLTDGTWQRRLVGRGSSWETLHLEPEARKIKDGREIMTKRWVWR